MASLSKNKIKTIRSLQKKKFRAELRAFVVEGDKLVREALDSGASIRNVFLRVDSNLAGRVEDAISVSEKDMKSISALYSPSPSLAVVEFSEANTSRNTLHNRILALDGNSDPGNVGTIIRTADWFGVRQIICSPDCVDFYNPKTVQATMGSIFRVDLERTELNERLKELQSKGYRVIVSDLEGKDLSPLKTSSEEKAVLVIGSESHGASSEVLKTADQRVRIEGFGAAESLNAAVATSILLYEWSRYKA